MKIIFAAEKKPRKEEESLIYCFDVFKNCLKNLHWNRIEEDYPAQKMVILLSIKLFCFNKVLPHQIDFKSHYERKIFDLNIFLEQFSQNEQKNWVTRVRQSKWQFNFAFTQWTSHICRDKKENVLSMSVEK